MKIVEAVIQRLKLEEVRSALDEIGVEEMLETEVISRSSRTQRAMTFRGAKFVAGLVEKVKLEVIAADDSVGRIIDAISCIARTGRQGDCRIAIRPYLELKLV